MFDVKKIPNRESTREVLDRLKAQEKRQSANTSEIHYINMDPRKPVESRESQNIPEYNIEQILRQINALEKKMKEDTSNYLNLYHDLRKLEDKFLKAVEFAKVNNIQVKDNISREISAREQIISRRSKRSV